MARRLLAWAWAMLLEVSNVMGLSSSINFRTNPVDPVRILAATPSTGVADEPSVFERHLDELGRNDESPVDRAAAARDDQRQRSDTARGPKRTDGTSSSPDEVRDETVSDDATPVAVAVPVEIASAGRKPLDSASDDTAVASIEGEEEATAPLAAAPVAEEAGDDENAKAPLETFAAVSAEASKSTETGKIDAAGANDDASGKIPAATVVPPPDVARNATQPIAAQATQTETPTPPSVSAGTVAASSAEAAQTAATAEGRAQETETDPDAGLAVKSKEGLGHETAARMAEKNGVKEAGAAQTPPAAQATVAQAAAQATASTTKPTTAGNAGVSAIASVETGEGPLAPRSGDLQGTGAGASGQSNTPIIRIGTLPGQAHPTQVPAMAIALQIARNLQNGTNRFDIRLDPPEMGRIDVRMEVRNDGTVSAHLTVEKAQTLDLLQRDARALQQALNDAGLQADSDSLNFSLRDQTAGGDGRDYTGSRGTGSAAAASASIAEESIATAAYNINLSATGGVDIRV